MTVASDQMPVLLVGYGARGSLWNKVLEAAGTAFVAGIVEPRPLQYPTSVPTYTSIPQGLQASGAVAAIIATPPSSHKLNVEACIHAGVPVLCEKPLCETLVDAQALVRAAAMKGVGIAVGMNFRYVPAVRALQRIVGGGQLGFLTHGQFTYIRNRTGTARGLNRYPLTMLDPMLLEQAVHHFDLIRFAYGREITHVSADMWNPEGSPYLGKSCVSASMTMEGGARVGYLGTWSSGSDALEYEWRTDLTGGLAVQFDPFGNLFTSRVDGQDHINAWSAEPFCEPLVPERLFPCRPFWDDAVDLLASFLVRVSSGVELETSGLDHCGTLAVLDAVRESSRLRREVEVEIPSMAAIMRGT